MTMRAANNALPDSDRSAELSRGFILWVETTYLSASIDIAFYPEHGEDMDALVRSADRAV